MEKTENIPANTALLIKQAVLKSWTKILLNQGKIDIKKYNRMISGIEKLKA